MGIRLFPKSRGNTAPPNPDPAVFRIVRSHEIRCPCLTVVMVHYPGCTTYGGNKVSVYRETLATIELAGSLDPHFSDSGSSLSPIARFCADERGWRLAVIFAETLEAIEREVIF